MAAKRTALDGGWDPLAMLGLGGGAAKRPAVDVRSPAKQSESERRKMEAIGGDLFSRESRRATVGVASPTPATVTTTAQSPLPPTARPVMGAASPAAPPSTANAAVGTMSPSTNGVGSDVASATPAPLQSSPSMSALFGSRPPTIEARVAIEMENAKDRPVHLVSTWLTGRKAQSAEVQAALIDDWLASGSLPGEKLVMRLEQVSYCRSDGTAVPGTLVMTSYQLYFEPLRPDPRLTSGHPLGGGKLSIPLSTIERIEMERGEIRRKGISEQLHMIDLTCKDMRSLKFAFASADFCKRAATCLDPFVFPNKEDYLFAFHYKVDRPFPAEIDGWRIYDIEREFKRLGLPSKSFRFSDINKEYKLCNSYPPLLCVPASTSDADLTAIGAFRSRRRLPALTWIHPNGSASIWRCSQPRVGMNMTRCLEDEKMLQSISDLNGHHKTLYIFDCRPKINAVGNKFAGKGYEIVDFYKNANVRFMDIENIHVMRDSYQKLTRACLKASHDMTHVNAVAATGWLAHISGLLKSTYAMISAIDRDKASILSHCSDGWDRTTQLVSLTEICMDPYYRTLEGFFVLIEKDWLSFGHKFHQRTGHRDKNHADDQRAPIFLQWCDAVYQLTEQFPRHFQFNSHLLVTMMNHLYSCRFGTFFFNSDRKRKKFTVAQRTHSIWTYFLGSPAAHAGEFINPYYSPSGAGVDDYNGVPPSMSPAVDDSDILATNGMTDGESLSIPSSAPMAIPGVAPATARRVASGATPSPPSGSPLATSSLLSSSVEAKVAAAATVAASSAAAAAAATGAPPTASTAGLPSMHPTGQLLRGAVLYPNWSTKKLQLWSDYFLRWATDDGLFGPMGPGSVAPYGATTAGFTSTQAQLQKQAHKMVNDAHLVNAELTRARTKLAEMEAEMKALRAQLATGGVQLAAAPSPVAAAAAAAAAGAASVAPLTDDTPVVVATRTSSSGSDGGMPELKRGSSMEDTYELMVLTPDGTQANAMAQLATPSAAAAATAIVAATATPAPAVPITATTNAADSAATASLVAPSLDASTIAVPVAAPPTAAEVAPAADSVTPSIATALSEAVATPLPATVATPAPPPATTVSPSPAAAQALLSSLLGDDSDRNDTLLGASATAFSSTMASLKSPFDEQ